MKNFDSIVLVNRETIEELFDMLEEDALEIFDDFISDAPKLVQQLLYSDTDSEQLIRSSHTLKSCATYVGAERLSELAREIEEQLHQDVNSDTQELLSLIQPLLDESIIEFQAAIAEVKS